MGRDFGGMDGVWPGRYAFAHPSLATPAEVKACCYRGGLLPLAATHDPDVFRRKRLYTREVAELLGRFEPVLRTIFDYYSTVEGDPLQLDLKTPEPTMIAASGSTLFDALY